MSVGGLGFGVLMDVYCYDVLVPGGVSYAVCFFNVGLLLDRLAC